MSYFQDCVWANFRSQHRDWLDRHEADHEVLYRLPARMIAVLARPLSHGRTILSSADCAAETAFDDLCKSFGAEGVCREAPIAYHFLRSALAAPDPEDYRDLGWGEQEIAPYRGLIGQTQNWHLRLTGYVGRLISDPTFLAARDEVRAAFEALPGAPSHDLPPPRDVVTPRPHRVARFRAAREEAQQRFEAFCDRYGLLGMATWDLPTPAGPLAPGIPLPAHLYQGRSVVLALPAHFSLRSTDDLVALLREQQRQAIGDAGLAPDCVSPRADETFVHLFALDHFGRVATRRYGQPPRPKGFVTRLNEALAAHLHVTPEHARDLQRRLAGCLRG